MKRKSVPMMVVAIALLLAGMVPAAAQSNKADLIIRNGTGGEISKLVISPAKARYPKNQDCLVFKKLAISDTATFTVALPDQFKGIDAFDIDLVSDGKRYKTQKEVNINFKSEKLPTLELSMNGKDSTRALIGAASCWYGYQPVATVLYTGTLKDIMKETFGVFGTVFGLNEAPLVS